jgi:hypothetical protein
MQISNKKLNSLIVEKENFRVSKSRRMRRAGHVTRMGEVINTKFLLENEAGDLGVDGKIILELIFREIG